MIFLAYGLPGMGKTLWMHDFAKAQPEQLFIVNDHAAEWGPDAAHWRGKPPASIQIFEGSQQLPKPEDIPDSGIIVIRGREAGEIATLVKEKGFATYVDDELDFAAGRKGWLESPLREIVHQGRHLENAAGEFTRCHIIGACRRPQSLHTDVTDIVDEVYIFRLQGSRTLERLKSDSMIEDEDWDAIRNMEKFHFKHWPSGQYLAIEPLGENNGGSDGQTENGGGQRESDSGAKRTKLRVVPQSR